MKKLLVVITIFSLFLLTSSIVYSQESKECEKVCLIMAEMAETIMSGRQAGLPLETMLELVEKDSLAELLIKIAFEESILVESIEMKTFMCLLFGMEIYTECIDNCENP